MMDFSLTVKEWFTRNVNYLQSKVMTGEVSYIVCDVLGIILII